MPSVNPGPAQTQTPNTVAELIPVNTLQKPVEVGANDNRLLAVARAVNVNALGDAAVMPVINAATYAVTAVLFANSSISLTTAAAGLFTAPAAGGTAIVANAALSALTGPTVVSSRTVTNGTVIFSGQSLYLNVGTAQGAAATMDVFIYGYDLT
jgi:hypothetical protein